MSATIIVIGEAAMIIRRNHLSKKTEAFVGEQPFKSMCPYPEAPAVDPRYLAAIKAQRETKKGD